MSTAEQLKEDLEYVRGAVQRDRLGRMPRAIALVWAAYVAVGFAGLDIRPAWGGVFLLVGGPIAFLVSMRLGLGAALASGISDRGVMRRHKLHWGSLFPAITALLFLAAEGRLEGEAFGQVILILAGLVYFLGGVHFQIRLLQWLGPMMMCGAVALNYIDRWGWTALGILIAAGIVASSFISRSND